MIETMSMGLLSVQIRGCRLEFSNEDVLQSLNIILVLANKA